MKTRSASARRVEEEAGLPAAVREGVFRIVNTVRVLRRLEDPEARYERILRAALDLVPADRAFLACGSGRHGENGRPLVVAGRSADGEAIAHPEFYVDHGLLRQACEAATEIVAAASSLEIDRECRGTQPRSALVIGRRIAEGMPAALYLDRAPSRPTFTEEERARAGAFAEEVFLELERAALRQVAEERRHALEARQLMTRPPAEEGTGRVEVATDDGIPGYGGIVGRSDRMQRVFEVIEKVRDTNLNVFIQGESGTGKELVARAIHSCGKRRDRPFLSESCGSIPENLLESELFGHVKGAFTGADSDKEGIFELADGGTLFLDEISDMSQAMQTKLLRVLQEGRIRPVGGKETRAVDVRIITASHRDLEALVRSGKFRMDLYYRLNVITVGLPPLRERREDVPLLAEHFLRELCREDGVVRRIAPAGVKALVAHSWPGNVRELRNVIRRVALTTSSRTIARKDIVPLLEEGGASSFSGQRLRRVEGELILRIPARERFNDIIAECERLVLESALEAMRWNKSRVTKALKIPRQSLYNKIERYGIKRSWE